MNRTRVLFLGLALAVPTFGAFLAQPKVAVPEPGKPPQFALPSSPATTQEGATVSVAPGPEPWYSLFGTGEVVGYIEPCG